jgi:hypothetical protein
VELIVAGHTLRKTGTGVLIITVLLWIVAGKIYFLAIAPRSPSMSVTLTILAGVIGRVRAVALETIVVMLTIEPGVSIVSLRIDPLAPVMEAIDEGLIARITGVRPKTVTTDTEWIGLGTANLTGSVVTLPVIEVMLTMVDVGAIRVSL